MGVHVGTPHAPAPATDQRRRDDLHRTFLRLSPLQFRVTWALIALSHLVNAAFALIAAGAHLLLAIPAIYENSSLLWVRKDMLQLAGWSYVAIGLLHVGVLASDIVRSMLQCSLTFGDDHRHHDQKTKTPLLRGVWSPRFFAKPVQMWRDYLSVDGAFGARGDRFEEFFHLRQFVEIVLQTYQAYQLSRAIPRTWILHGVVAIMAVNGIGVIAIEAVLHKKHPLLSRVVLLAVDLVVDLLIAVVVPVVIILPRILSFDVSTTSFPQRLIYDDVWITTAVLEARQIFVTSEIDFISSLLPHVLWLLGLDTIKSMVLRASSRVTSIPSLVGPGTGSLLPPARDATSKCSVSSKPPTSIWSRNLKGACVIWTLSVVCVHIAANVSSHDMPSTLCSLRVPTWLSLKLPCAVVNINCHRLGTLGSDATVADALDTFDRLSLARVIFSHCSALHVPPSITQFGRLRAFMTFNSTIASWPASAALTQTHTPMVVAMDLIHTNFSTPTFPDGIFHSTLPTGMNFLLFQSNLSSLPDDIGVVWASHKWVSFWIENANLRGLPDSFGRLDIQKLALIGNNIALLEDDLFATQRPSWVRLSRTPLSRLPSSLESDSVLDGLTHLLVENTSITSISTSITSWMEAHHQQRIVGTYIVSFRGSPLCSRTDYEAACGDVAAASKDEYRFDLVAPQRPL